MASSFDRWEKDPFFSAAEQVQESADRMESSYRTWIHAKRDASSIWNAEEFLRDLQTAVGTTKWQLEVFEKAVKSSYVSISGDDGRDRHQEFIIAIDNRISRIENSMHESTISEGKASLPWVRLEEGECNELALFLTRPSIMVPSMDKKKTGAHEIDNELLPGCSTDSRCSNEWGSGETVMENPHSHRRAASASPDVGAWKISVVDGSCPQSSSSGQPEMPPRKVPSYSGLLNTVKSASKLKWSKNGFRKWKIADRHAESHTKLLQPSLPTRGINACSEKMKSSLDDCDDCYEKQLYGWYGAIQRLFQRSQYQMQYHPMQVMVWVLLFLFLTGKWGLGEILSIFFNV